MREVVQRTHEAVGRIRPSSTSSSTRCHQPTFRLATGARADVWARQVGGQWSCEWFEQEVVRLHGDGGNRRRVVGCLHVANPIGGQRNPAAGADPTS